MDETGAYAKLLGVRGVPTNVLVDSTGTVRAFGAGNPDDLNAAVDEILRDSPRCGEARLSPRVGGPH